MNKFLARVLSIVMLITAVSTNINSSIFVEQVYANEVNFDVYFSRGLGVGPIDSVPVATTLTGNDTAWLQWDMNNFGGTTFTTGDFELKYPLRDGVEVLFTVQKIEDKKAIVEYKLINSADGSQLATNNYMIYSHRANNYVSLKSFISNGYNSSEDSYQVLDVDDMGNSINYPRFVVGTDRGFSFKYNNVDVHIKWDSATNKMFFYTNKIQKGYIVEPELTVSVDGVTKTFNKRITSGIASSTFTAKPYANEDKFLADIVQIIGNEATDDKFPSNDEEDRGVILTFDVLKEWDDTTHTFSKEPTGYKIPAEIKMYALDNKKSIHLSIPDTKDTSLSTTDITVSPKGGAVVKSATRVGDTITIELGNLDAGIIYDPTEINILPDLTLPSDQRLVSNSTEIEFGKVFTFPYYEIISQNNKLYLSASPFEGYAGEFLLKTGITQSVSSRQQSDGKSQIIFPLAINSQSKFSEYFQLYFSPGKVFEDTTAVNATNTIHSQILLYKPTDEDSGITIPNNFYIVEEKHIKDDSVSDLSKGFLELTIRWDIGLKDGIDAMVSSGSAIDINYELSSTLTPDSANVFPVADINVNISRNADGVLEVKYSGGDQGLGENYIANYVVNSGVAEELKFKYQSDSNDNVYYAETTLLFKTAVSDYAGNDINEIYFRYPNIYFFTIDPTSVDKNGDGTYEDINISGSVFESVTLNYLEEATLNPPQNLLLTNNTYTSIANGDSSDEVSFEINYTLSGQSLKEYFNETYSSNQIKEILKGSYDVKPYFNVYITQKETNLTEKFPKYTYSEREDNSVEVEYKSAYGDRIYLSNINGNAGVKTTSGTNPITELRNGKVVKISEYPMSDSDLQDIINNGVIKSYYLTLDGLDTNTKYYVTLDLVVEDLEKSPTTLNYSDLTPIKAITTKDSLTVVKPGETDPNAPEIFEIETTTYETMLGWNKVFAEKDENSNIEIEYELIRLKDKPMKEEYLDTKENFDTTWNNFVGTYTKEGFRTKANNILMYEKGNFVSSDKELYKYSSGTTPITFEDNTLIPNTVYYYYIRTVKIIEGEEMYSVWERVSVTTSNLKGPINLVAMFDEYDPRINLKSEVYLKFDVPINDLTQLGSVYNIELAIKKESENFETPIIINPKDLKTDGVVNEDGYITMIYKVTKLEPGTTYSFKVRLGLIKEGTKSLYSNIVRIRTETDQDEYDKENEIDNWADYIKDKLEDLLNGDYWEISNDSNKKEIVYRESKFDGLLKVVNDSFLKLQDADLNKENHYYIPVNSLIKANNKNIGFKIKAGDVTLTLSSSMIDTTLNNALKPLSQNIKDGNIEDYYLDIVVKADDTVEKINSTSISSPVLEVSVVTKAFKKPIEEFEYEVYTTLLEEFITEDLEKLIKEDVEDVLDDDMTNENIIKRLNSEIEDIAEDVFKEVKDLFDDSSSAERYNTKITTFDAPLIISNPSESATNATKAYKLLGETWINENVKSFGNNDLIVVYEGGTYAFVSTNIVIGNISSVTDAAMAHEILVKYDLYDILKDANGVNASKVISRYEAYASIAKILGNNGSKDPAEYLNSLGMGVTIRNTNQSITEEEFVYLIMNIYKYNTNTSIDSYNIRNYAQMASIENVSAKYLKSIQVAVDLGIINLSTFSPKKEVTVQTFLDRLLEVGSKVGI